MYIGRDRDMLRPRFSEHGAEHLSVAAELSSVAHAQEAAELQDA